MAVRRAGEKHGHARANGEAQRIQAEARCNPRRRRRRLHAPDGRRRARDGRCARQGADRHPHPCRGQPGPHHRHGGRFGACAVRHRDRRGPGRPRHPEGHRRGRRGPAGGAPHALSHRRAPGGRDPQARRIDLRRWRQHRGAPRGAGRARRNHDFRRGARRGARQGRGELHRPGRAAGQEHRPSGAGVCGDGPCASRPAPCDAGPLALDGPTGPRSPCCRSSTSAATRSRNTSPTAWWRTSSPSCRASSACS